MKFNILIIDDEKNIREGLAAALEMDGYNVVLASDGETGLNLVGRGDIDLLLQIYECLVFPAKKFYLK